MKKLILSVLVLTLCVIFASCECEHVFSEWEVQTESTCDVAGIEVRTCSECGEKEEKELALLEHTFGEWTVSKEATCTEKGEEKSTCSVCQYVQTRETDMIEHTYGEWVVSKEATCIEKGEEISNCLVCNISKSREIEFSSHDFGGWETIDSAKCTEEGTKIHKCKICDFQEESSVPALGHNYKKNVVKQVSCTSDGEIKHMCSNCDDSYEETVKSTGHKWINATCTAAKTCSICKTTEGTALGHNNEGKCTRCGKTITIDIKTKVSAPTEEFAILRGKNSVGLVNLAWTANNISEKRIKYYSVTCYYYNSVGDLAKNDITGKSSYTVKFVGPVEPNGGMIVSEIGYCSICDEVLIGEITLEYMDGTVDTGWYGYRIKIP